MTRCPKISVVIPCYNQEQYAADAIESVLAQSHPDWELILVDDGSEDRTPAILDRYARTDERIQTIHQENKGVSYARQAGFNAASCHSAYLLFLDGDDILEPTMIEELIDVLESHPNAAAAYCQRIWIDANNQIVANDEPTMPPRLVPTTFGLRALPDTESRTPFFSIYAWAGIIPSNTMIRKNHFEQVGGWDASVPYGVEDMDLFLRLSLEGTVHYVNKPLLRYRQHGSQVSADLEKTNELLRDLRRRWVYEDSYYRTARRPEVTEAWHYYHGRHGAMKSVQAGLRHLKRKNIEAGVRDMVAGLRRYTCSLLPHSWRWTWRWIQ